MYNNITSKTITNEENGTLLKKRVCIYARAARASQEQQAKFDTQIAEYTEHIASNPNWELVGVYTDIGSGLSTNHPAFLAMMEVARNGGIDIIMVKSISQISRQYNEVVKIICELEAIGVDVCDESIEMVVCDDDFKTIFQKLVVINQTE